MSKRETLAKLMLSPWKAMFASVLISVFVYITISILSGNSLNSFGLAMSAIIPAVVSFPLSYLLIFYYKKIEVQKEELERLNELNNRLFSIISHDIRSPISGVYGILDLINMDALSKDELSTYISDLSITVDNLLSFLDEIMQWSRAQIDKKEIEPELFDAQKVWNQVISLYQHNLDSKNIELKTSNLEETIYADQGSYSFIIRNIIQNAIKFTPEKGLISVDIKKQGSRTITSIRDSGVGISPENLDKILYGKEWVTTPGTNNEKGNGFGVKASVKYAEMLKGSFHIESTPGKGTTVVIDLPGNSSH